MRNILENILKQEEHYKRIHYPNKSNFESFLLTRKLINNYEPTSNNELTLDKIINSKEIQKAIEKESEIKVIQNIKIKNELDLKEEQDERRNIKLNSISNVNSKPIYSYFCSLCGNNTFLLDTMLEKLPQRQFDKSYIINKKEIYVNSNLSRDLPILISKSNNSVERRMKLKCYKCGIMIGYYCDDDYLYIINISTVSDPSLCEFYSEFEKEKKSNPQINKLLNEKRKEISNLKKKENLFIKIN